MQDDRFREIDLITLGCRLKGLRGDSDSPEFAQCFRVDTRSLARWENGESQPDISFLVRLAAAYGLSLEWLITGESDPEVKRLDRLEYTLPYREQWFTQEMRWHRKATQTCCWVLFLSSLMHLMVALLPLFR